MNDHSTNSRVQAAELEALTTEFFPSLKRAIVLWLLRWIIGFGVIAFVVTLWPSFAWLWWAGAAVAGLSLFSMLFMRAVLRRKTATVHQRLGELDRMVEELEEDASRD